MKHIIVFALLGILVLLMMVKGCCYRPTSYRAFIPKALDSEYKEYERLCKEERGKVFYARPVEKGIELDYRYKEIKISDSLSVMLGDAKSKDGELLYLYVDGFIYYTNWVVIELCPHGGSKESFACLSPFFTKDSKEEDAILENIISHNKESIGNNEIVKEYTKFISLSHSSSKTYISQIFKEAIYDKNSHYLGNKEFK